MKEKGILRTLKRVERNIGEEQIEMRNKREKESWQRMGKKSMERECECE